MIKKKINYLGKFKIIKEIKPLTDDYVKIIKIRKVTSEYSIDTDYYYTVKFSDGERREFKGDKTDKVGDIKKRYKVGRLLTLFIFNDTKLSNQKFEISNKKYERFHTKIKELEGTELSYGEMFELMSKKI